MIPPIVFTPQGPVTVQRTGRIIDGHHIGDAFNGLAINSCGHYPKFVLIVAGCVEGDVREWLSCDNCQMTDLRELRPGTVPPYLSCGHECADLIYKYLPGHSQYPDKDRVYDYKGRRQDMT